MKITIVNAVDLRIISVQEIEIDVATFPDPFIIIEAQQSLSMVSDAIPDFLLEEKTCLPISQPSNG